MDDKIKKIKIPSLRGNIVVAIHYPETENGRLVILCPGYLDSKDYKHLVGLAEALGKQGYTVVRFDPTGTWESDGDISDYSVTQYLEDIKNVLEYMLRGKEYKQILLGGHSRGGFVSMLYAIRDPRISIVLSIMSSYSISATSDKETLDNWEKEGCKKSFRDTPGEKGSKEFCVPYAHALDGFQYNALDKISGFHGALILVAGELDDVAKLEDIKLIYDKANDPKKLIFMKDIGHNYRHNDDEIEIVNRKIIKQLICKI